MIEHDERYQVNVRTRTNSGGVQGTKGNPFAIEQDQSLLRQDTAQVELDGAITAVANVQVDGSTCLLRDEFLQVRGVADTEFLDVLRPIGIHRVRTGFFRRGNVRTGHDHPLDFSRRRRHYPGNSRSRQLSGCA